MIAVPTMAATVVVVAALLVLVVVVWEGEPVWRRPAPPVVVEDDGGVWDAELEVGEEPVVTVTVGAVVTVVEVVVDIPGNLLVRSNGENWSVMRTSCAVASVIGNTASAIRACGI